MIDNKKRGIIGGGFIVIIALILLVIGFVRGNTNTKSIVSNEFVKEDQVLDDFNDIKLNVDIGDVEILDGDKYSIYTKYNKNNADLSYSVSDNKLTVSSIKKKEQKKFFDFSNNDDNEVNIKIYVPKDTKLDTIDGNVEIGDLNISNVDTENLKVESSCGETGIDKITCNKIDLQSNTGEISLKTLKADDAEIKNGTGEISGKDITTNGLKLTSKVGNISIDGKLSGKNIIDTGTGNIDITSSLSRNDYEYDIDSGNGNINIDKEECKKDFKTNGSSSNLFKVKSSNGNIDINFAK